MNDHKEWVRGVFDRAAPKYGSGGCSFFDYFGNRLVAQAGIETGKHVLDVATGKGALLFALAQVVGPTGRVIGVDISPKMLQETRKISQVKGLDWIDLQQMDAENLEYPDNSFDFVSCGFALFFFPSLSKALSEFFRVLKPGGKLLVSVWGRKPKLTAWVVEQCKKLSNMGSLAASPIRGEEDVRTLLEIAHFKDIRIFDELKVFSYATKEEWWNSLWAQGTRAALEKLSKEQVNTLKEAALEQAQRTSNGSYFSEEFHALYAIGRKPN